MVRPRKQRRTRRRRANVHVESAVFLGQCSPATTVTVGYGQLIQYIQGRPFKFLRCTITAAALDVASANKATFGPACFQLRQLVPLDTVSASTATAVTSVIKSTRPYMVGNNPRTFRINFNKFRYPADGKLDCYIALDTLCLTKGTEIGINYTLTIELQVFHEYESEKCPATVVSTALFNATL